MKWKNGKMLINVIPWTRLNKTTFWNSVSFKYSEPWGRDYHNIAHIIKMYNYAQKLKIPYDVNLDVAILIHDMIYDENPNKEVRTTYEFIQMLNKANGLGKVIKEVDYIEHIKIEPYKIIDMVHSTINHSPSTAIKAGVPLDLMLLDLYGLSQNTKFNDYNLIYDECVKLYKNAKPEEIKYNMKENMRRILGNIMVYVSENENENDKHVQNFVEIGNGIQEILTNVEK